jgi:hypothetical protein
MTLLSVAMSATWHAIHKMREERKAQRRDASIHQHVHSINIILLATYDYYREMSTKKSVGTCSVTDMYVTWEYSPDDTGIIYRSETY